MPGSFTEVLDHQQITDRIRRIAWQIYENYHHEDEVILAGIADRGFQLAELLQSKLTEISPLKIQLLRIRVNKKDPLADAPAVEPQLDFQGKSIIVVDDVLNTGSTLIYGVRYFLDYKVKAIATAVLVDRSHKRFPVKADHKGLSLSTSMLEHVEVKIDREPYSVVVS